MIDLIWFVLGVGVGFAGAIVPVAFMTLRRRPKEEPVEVKRGRGRPRKVETNVQEPKQEEKPTMKRKLKEDEADF